MRDVDALHQWPAVMRNTERPMTLRHHFHSYLDRVRREGRYRIFADLERDAARPPYARWRDGSNCREVVVWCSNDYLGMGRHPLVIDAMVKTGAADGRRRRGYAQYFRQ